MTHDHLIECTGCGIPVSDIRDCTCSSPAYSLGRCRFCKEQDEYDRIERARNG